MAVPAAQSHEAARVFGVSTSSDREGADTRLSNDLARDFNGADLVAGSPL